MQFRAYDACCGAYNIELRTHNSAKMCLNLTSFWFCVRAVYDLKLKFQRSREGRASACRWLIKRSTEHSFTPTRFKNEKLVTRLRNTSGLRCFSNKLTRIPMQMRQDNLRLTLQISVYEMSQNWRKASQNMYISRQKTDITAHPATHKDRKQAKAFQTVLE